MAGSAVKPMEDQDFADLQDAIYAVNQTVKDLHLLPATRRQLWEWASGVQAMVSLYGEKLGQQEIRALDVEPKGGLIGPTLANVFGVQVTEYEPDAKHRSQRFFVNQHLDRLKRKTLRVEEGGVANLPPLPITYDAVFALGMSAEVEAWNQLALRVKPWGLLYVTTASVGQKLVRTVDRLCTHGFTPMGHPDWPAGSGLMKIGLMRTESVTN